MKENNLIVPKNYKLRAVRTMKPKPQANRINQYWGIDMTKILTARGWAYITVVLDWYTKEPCGWHIGQFSKAKDWLYAVENALENAKIETNKNLNLSIISDNGCQPTSHYFKNKCKILGLNQIFASFNNPKGNAETERFMRTMKEELLWIKEWKNIEEVEVGLNKWLSDFKNNYRHSKLNYKTVNEFKQQILSQNQLLPAA